jgi:hypothetical protein
MAIAASAPVLPKQKKTVLQNRPIHWRTLYKFRGGGKKSVLEKQYVVLQSTAPLQLKQNRGATSKWDINLFRFLSFETPIGEINSFPSWIETPEARSQKCNWKIILWQNISKQPKS